MRAGKESCTRTSTRLGKNSTRNILVIVFATGCLLRRTPRANRSRCCSYGHAKSVAWRIAFHEGERSHEPVQMRPVVGAFSVATASHPDCESRVTYMSPPSSNNHCSGRAPWERGTRELHLSLMENRGTGRACDARLKRASHARPAQLLTSIRRGRTSARFGIFSTSTPSFRAAWILSLSSSLPSTKLRR